MEELQKFGARLRGAIEAANTTNVALAAHLGVKKQTISNWTADRNPPSVVQLFKICRFLNVTADFLIFGVAHGVSLPALRIAVGYDQLTPKERSQWEHLVMVVKPGGPRDFGDASHQDEGIMWDSEKTLKESGKPGKPGTGGRK